MSTYGVGAILGASCAVAILKPAEKSATRRKATWRPAILAAMVDGMRSSDLTRDQARALKNKIGPMLGHW